MTQNPSKNVGRNDKNGIIDYRIPPPLPIYLKKEGGKKVRVFFMQKCRSTFHAACYLQHIKMEYMTQFLSR